MSNLNTITRDNVRQAALDTRTTDQRWLTAIRKALTALETQSWLFDGQHMQIKGSRGTWYTVTPQTCECKAFEIGVPCVHRAAVTLLVHAARMPVLASKAERMVKVSPAEAAVARWEAMAIDADVQAAADELFD